MLDELRAKLERLEADAAPLEPDSDARRELGGQALEHALAYWDQVETASTNRPWSEVFSRRLDPEFSEEGRELPDVLDYVRSVRRRARLRHHQPAVHGLHPGRRRALRSAGRPAGRDVEQIFRLRIRQPRRGADRERLHEVAGQRYRLSGDGGRHTDVGRQRRQSYRRRGRPRGARSRGRRGGLHYALRTLLRRQGAPHRRAGALAAPADRDRRKAPDVRRSA